MLDPTEPPRPDIQNCVTCGFLCRHDILNTHLPIYAELTGEDRENGAFFLMYDHRMPWCFREVDILREVCEVSGLGVTPPGGQEPQWIEGQREAAGLVFNQDRQCLLWFPYKAGVPPDRRFEHLKMQTFEQRREAFDERMQARSEETQREMRRETKIGVGLQVAVAAAGIIASLIITTSKPPVSVTVNPIIVLATPEAVAVPASTPTVQVTPEPTLSHAP